MKMDTIKAKIRGFEPGSDVGSSNSQFINKHVKMLKMITLNRKFILRLLLKPDDCFQEESFVYITVTQSSRLTSFIIKVENELYIFTSCYFCTSAASEDEINVLHDKFRDIITDSKDENMKCIVEEDFNAKVIFNNNNEKWLNGNVLGNERVVIICSLSESSTEEQLGYHPTKKLKEKWAIF
uniref:RNA-directed DNA polymerase, eukaryota, reverse transcriptase zinc-binding domain protein n=1 Tax=Strongyloides venezuelensis TaxID=75913 RepID=A0A0K0FH28_STRVS